MLKIIYIVDDVRANNIQFFLRGARAIDKPSKIVLEYSWEILPSGQNRFTILTNDTWFANTNLPIFFGQPASVENA